MLRKYELIRKSHPKNTAWSRLAKLNGAAASFSVSLLTYIFLCCREISWLVLNRFKLSGGGNLWGQWRKSKPIWRWRWWILRSVSAPQRAAFWEVKSQPKRLGSSRLPFNASRHLICDFVRLQHWSYFPMSTSVCVCFSVAELESLSIIHVHIWSRSTM